MLLNIIVAFYFSNRYMKRRCEYLDTLPPLKYPTQACVTPKKRSSSSGEGASSLGSTLLKMMLEEVSTFTNPNAKENWSESLKQQVQASFN